MSGAEMSNLENEFNEHEVNKSWVELFEEIDRLSSRHSKNVAMEDNYKDLNRYYNVAPFDQSRIKLKRTTHDYINASLVEVPQANRRYILTQGPLAQTIAHFWVMIWEQDSRAIVMLNRLVEQTIQKCEFYWPEGNGDNATLELKDVKLTVKFVSLQSRRNFSIREFLITDHTTNQSRTINQFHYTKWPDFGQPDSPVSFLKLLAAVRSSGTLDDHGPVVVHCSAGIGRSGTFCLIDSVLLMIETRGSSEDINIKDILLEMREHRAGLIQTHDQLRFSYMAIIYGAKLMNLLPNKAISSQQDNESKTLKKYSDSSYDNCSNVTSKSTKRLKASNDRLLSLVEALENVDSDDEGAADNSASIEPPHLKIARHSAHVLGSSPSSSTHSSASRKNNTNTHKESLEISSKTTKHDKNFQQKKSPTKNSRPSNLTLESNIIGDITPLPSPGNVMNQPLLGRKTYSEASKNSTGTNILQRRRERELRNQRIAEKTKSIRENIRNNEAREDQRVRRLRLLKKVSVCGIAAAVFGSAFYLYYKSYFSN